MLSVSVNIDLQGHMSETIIDDLECVVGHLILDELYPDETEREVCGNIMSDWCREYLTDIYKVRGRWQIPIDLLPDLIRHCNDPAKRKAAVGRIVRYSTLNARKTKLQQISNGESLPLTVAPKRVSSARIYRIGYRHPSDMRVRFHTYTGRPAVDRAIARWREKGCTVIYRMAIKNKAA